MKKLFALILAMAMLLTLAACAASPETTVAPSEADQASTPGTTQQSAEDPYFVGYAAPGLSSEFNMMIYDGLNKFAAEEGVRLETLSCEGDVAKQIEHIETFITMGVDCILVFPVDAGSCTDALIRARQAGIKVVTADVNVGRDAYDLAYSYSEEALGKACARAAAAWIDQTFPDAAPGSVTCAIIGAGFSEQALARGDYQATVTEYTDKANLVEVYNVGLENFATLSEQYTQVILQNYPDIACIISFTDTLALIADEIIMQTDMDISKIGQFTVDLSKNGFDAITASKDNKSTIRGTVGFPDICEHLFNMVMGRIETDENGICFLEPSTVTADDIDTYSYLYY